ncbi:MAG TPA: ADP-ribosylation/crystallin J1 [Vineibacter sp.]|nr:ADP-ribosylation/crystallin J1 [Vineibacter sp.]
MASSDYVILFRPVGPAELDLIRQASYSAFPPRLLEQPIFYPVLTEEYAVKIARDWNVPASGAGYVTRFKVLRVFLARYKVQDAAGRRFQEYWIPAEDLAEFNRNIVGPIEVIAEFHRDVP